MDLAGAAVLRTGQVGVVGADLAVDPATHHLFVLSLPPMSAQGGLDLWAATVSMIDTRTGAVLRATTIPETVIVASHLAVDSAHHRVYVSWATAQGNSLTVLDSRSDALLPRLFLASEGG